MHTYTQFNMHTTTFDLLTKLCNDYIQYLTEEIETHNKDKEECIAQGHLEQLIFTNKSLCDAEQRRAHVEQFAQELSNLPLENIDYYIAENENHHVVCTTAECCFCGIGVTHKNHTSDLVAKFPFCHCAYCAVCIDDFNRNKINFCPLCHPWTNYSVTFALVCQSECKRNWILTNMMTRWRHCAINGIHSPKKFLAKYLSSRPMQLQ